eukprot:TRINITY_DN2744_c4_g1_i1.p1 TRINITY_DN2744_c4_g1~~TRINITY_DN2744_c4_g1_i1.p1  ORF type:complete len:315 (+),score=64.24 TRINITY_DN2744_c4_g1_i1:70-945(+)
MATFGSYRSKRRTAPGLQATLCLTKLVLSVVSFSLLLYHPGVHEVAALMMRSPVGSVDVDDDPPLRVGPSILAGDLANIGNDAKRVVRAGADYIHLDVFDGNWIPGAFTFGPLVVKALRSYVPKAFLDAHLCVTNPERYIEEMAEAGVNRVTLHFEAMSDAVSAAKRAHSMGMEVGLAIAPKTPIDEEVLKLVEYFDVVLVMTVLPGFGGQQFMTEMLPKVSKLRAAFPHKAIEVDGGVNEQTAVLAAAAGANEAVAGTSVFRAKNVRKAIRALRKSLETGRKDRSKAEET